MRGFTLVEVLVTMFILVIGLLGLSKLMIKGQHTAFEAYQVQQGLALANDLAERLRSNEGAAVLYAAPSLGAAIRPLTQDCGAAPCTNAALAQYDLDRWNNLLYGVAESTAGASVGAMLNARGCVENINLNTWRVSVAWAGNVATNIPAGSLCGQGAFSATDKAKRRLVSLEVTVCRPSPVVAPFVCPP